MALLKSFLPSFRDAALRIIFFQVPWTIFILQEKNPDRSDREVRERKEEREERKVKSKCNLPKVNTRSNTRATPASRESSLTVRTSSRAPAPVWIFSQRTNFCTLLVKSRWDSKDFLGRVCSGCKKETQFKEHRNGCRMITPGKTWITSEWMKQGQWTMPSFFYDIPWIPHEWGNKYTERNR